MESGAAMSSESAAARRRSCEVCGTAAADGQVACSVCGAVLGAGVPTGSRPPVEPTNRLAVPAQPSGGESDQPRFTPAGLPARRPRAIDNDDAALDAFTRSWEAASDERLAADPDKLRPFAFTPPKPAPPPTRPPTIDDFIRGTTLGRDSVSAAAASSNSSSAAASSGASAVAAAPASAPSWRVPVEPPDPAPPTPPSPPDPASPPEPPLPPSPPGPPGPAPSPIPSPVPPPAPGPQPGPSPDSVPPVPTPDPVPTPRPTPPLPSPEPSPPGPVPPPPSMGRPLPPGVYRGGYLPEPSTVVAQAPQSRIVPAGRRPAGTVYGGQTGLPTSANADAPLERSGSLTGSILARGQSAQSGQDERRRARRRRVRTAFFVSLGLAIFMGAIAVIVYVLAGDFIRSLFDTITHFQ
jgi:hypothetical protein